MSARIGLVLGGGGITGGAFHAGILAALATSAAWDARSADVFLGTSAGAITSTSLAVGMPPADLLRRHLGETLSPEGEALLARVRGSRDLLDVGDRPLRPASPELLKSLVRKPSSAHPGRIAAAALPEGRVSTESIQRNMTDFCTGQWPSARLAITALRLSDGARVVFTEPDAPPIGAAVAASCAIPGYFAPVQIAGERYVDGGTMSSCNADVLANWEVDVVIISAPMAIHAGVRLAVDTPVRRVLRAQVDREAERLRAAGKRVFLFAPSGADVGAMGANPMATGREPMVAASAFAGARDRIEADPDLRQLGVDSG